MTNFYNSNHSEDEQEATRTIAAVKVWGINPLPPLITLNQWNKLNLVNSEQSGEGATKETDVSIA